MTFGFLRTADGFSGTFEAGEAAKKALIDKGRNAGIGICGLVFVVPCSPDSLGTPQSRSSASSDLPCENCHTRGGIRLYRCVKRPFAGTSFDDPDVPFGTIHIVYDDIEPAVFPGGLSRVDGAIDGKYRYQWGGIPMVLH
jgi:hypothetical protein